MHIPDGFLTAPVWGCAYVVSAAVVGTVANRAGNDLDDLKIPMMGVMGAFVFAAQMINFPVLPGTSGHLVGTVLLMALLGAQPAVLTVTCIVIVQCILFQDGGFTSLGANVLNMAILPVAVGYPVYRGIQKLLAGSLAGWLTGAAVASWITVLLTAIVATIEITVSGRWPLKESLAIMSGLHAVIGLGEAAITVAVLGFIAKVRPDLVPVTEGRT